MIHYILFGFFALVHSGNAAEKITLYDAVLQHRIKLAVSLKRDSLLGKVLQMRLTNNEKKPLAIDIPSGQIFATDDSTQFMLIPQSELIVLGANGNRLLSKQSYCINASLAPPSSDTKFTIAKPADGNLGVLVQFIHKNKYSGNAVQHAIWAITDNHDLGGIYDKSETTEKALQEVLSKLTGKPMPAYTVNYRLAHDRAFQYEALTIQGKLDFVLAKDALCSLEVVDGQGTILSTMYEDKAFKAGKWKTNYRLTATMLQHGQHYTARMRTNSGEIIASFSVTV